MDTVDFMPRFSSFRNISSFPLKLSKHSKRSQISFYDEKSLLAVSLASSCLCDVHETIARALTHTKNKRSRARALRRRVFLFRRRSNRVCCRRPLKRTDQIILISFCQNDHVREETEKKGVVKKRVLCVEKKKNTSKARVVQTLRREEIINKRDGK